MAFRVDAGTKAALEVAVPMRKECEVQLRGKSTSISEETQAGCEPLHIDMACPFVGQEQGIILPWTPLQVLSHRAGVWQISLALG